MVNALKTNPGKTLALTGAFLQLGPLAGNIGVAIDTFFAFRRYGAAIDAARASGGPAAAQAAAHNTAIETSLWSIRLASTGLVLGIIGLALLAASLFHFRYRAPWFFWFLIVYGALLLLGFPYATIIGTALILFCIIRKDEFLKRSDAKRIA